MKAGEHRMYMTVILIFVSILAVMGTLYNKRTNNKVGFLLGGLFTLAVVGVTLIAVYDGLIGVQ
ncbi:hypothetical protein [Desmospora activa]|nr:hypothetical protein [Desmospora activa]